MGNQQTKIGRFTFRLFNRPSFSGGLATLLSFSSNYNLYNTNETPKEADYQSLIFDWQAVGEDMWSAIDGYEQTQEKKQKQSTAQSSFQPISS